MEIIIFSEITALSNKNGYCSATNGYFAALYKKSPETVSRWIGHLEKLGHIRRSVIRDENNQVIERKLYPVTSLYAGTPPDEKVNSPIDKKINTPPDEKVKENSTRLNTTSIKYSLSKEKSGIENSLKSQHDIEKEKSCAKKESLPPEEQRILEAKKEVMRYFEEWPAMKERAEAAIQGSGKALPVVLEEWARNRLKVPYVLQNAHSHVSSDFIPWCDREGKFSAARKRTSENKNTQASVPIVNEYGKKREKGNELGLF
jgi:hypothetical protein